MTNYYTSLLDGDDANSGLDPSEAWKTLGRLNNQSKSPGDVLRLGRGSSWIGESLEIYQDGQNGSPIVVIDYGSGEPPTISRPGDLIPAVISNGAYVIFQKIKTGESGGFGFRIRGDHSAIRYCEVDHAGLGIGLQAFACAVTDSYIHDLQIVVSDEGGEEDYGATAIDCNGEWAEIARNRFVNCVAETVEWGLDGGAVELKGDVDHARVHHNIAINCFGFFEIGGFPGHCHDARVEDNQIIDCHQLGGMHLGGSYASDVKDFQYRRNIYVDNTENPAQVLWFHEGDPDPDVCLLEDNLFYIKQDLTRAFTLGDGFTHRGNQYFMRNTSIDFELDPTESLFED